MDPRQVDVVLVRPARPANVAAAARAMKNMGLLRLKLVSPPRELSDFDARALAYGAWDVLDAAVSEASLEAALAGSTFAVAASGRGGPAAWTPRQLGQRAAERTRGGRLAIVFGPEASGLTNSELRLCHEVVTIPTDPAHPSLNLAQAVLVVAYELFVSGYSDAAAAGASPEPPAELPATAGAVEQALAELGDGLLRIGYLNPENPEKLTAELRRLFARAIPTTREVSLLRGMARQIGWAASRIAQTEREPGE